MTHLKCDSPQFRALENAQQPVFVRKGDVIAVADSSGLDLSNPQHGPHLHVEYFDYLTIGEDRLLMEMDPGGNGKKFTAMDGLQGHRIGKLQLDRVIEDTIILELKAAGSLHSQHVSQLLQYLAITGLKLGFLVNFGAVGKLNYKRVILEPADHPPQAGIIPARAKLKQIGPRWFRYAPDQRQSPGDRASPHPSRAGSHL